MITRRVLKKTDVGMVEWDDEGTYQSWPIYALVEKVSPYIMYMRGSTRDICNSSVSIDIQMIALNVDPSSFFNDEHIYW